MCKKSSFTHRSFFKKRVGKILPTWSKSWLATWSAFPNANLNSEGCLHHLIIIFCTLMENDDISRCFFIFFKFLFFRLLGEHSSNPPPLFKGRGVDFFRIGQKGGFIFFNKGRNRNKGWDGIIRGGGGIKKIYKTFSISLKETQTFRAY